MGLGITWLTNLIADMTLAPKGHREKKTKKHRKKKKGG